MNILILSDLHIDTNDKFGTFQWVDEDFIDQMERLRERHSIRKVIFNGDIFELLKYRYDEIKAAHPLLMKYFRDRDFIFIRGNHDLVNSYGLENYRVTNSRGQTIHIEHGHNADWFNGSKAGRSLSKFGFTMLKKLSHSRFMMDVYFRIVAFQEHINQIPKKYNTIKYLSYALKLLKEHDVVVLAHTHKLESHHTYYLNKKKRYLNCGSCSLGRFQGIILDTETLKYELIKKDRAVSREESYLRYAI